MPKALHLKICGNTREQDAELVGKCGADFCGVLVDVGFSERSLSLESARKLCRLSGIKNVILLCDPKLERVERIAKETEPYAIQLLCRESPEFVSQLKNALTCEIWKSVFLPVPAGQPPPEAYVSAGADALLVDAVDDSEGFQRFGGTGKVADWEAAASVVRSVSVPVFLAGGIRPENVEQAVLAVRPDGIDLCSGVEEKKGQKDPDKVRGLVERFESAVESLTRGEE